jgi:hypothetical protein
MIEAEHQPFDKSSKWMIQHHGDSILRLAKIENIQNWRPVQAEIVQPRQLPDGLLEVRLQDESQDNLFLLEVATYPERRISQQLTRGMMLVYLDRGELPEAVTLVLRPKGKYRVARGTNLRSRRGLSSCNLKWRVVELWNIPGEELLAAHDVGLIPWVPLTDFSATPESILERCRDTIQQDAPPCERANLLAVTQVLTYLRYNDVGLLTILGGTRTMIESPLIQELVSARIHKCIVAFLETRFGQVPRDLVEQIQAVDDEDQLNELVRSAASCRDLDSFRTAMR